MSPTGLYSKPHKEKFGQYRKKKRQNEKKNTQPNKPSSLISLVSSVFSSFLKGIMYFYYIGSVVTITIVMQIVTTLVLGHLILFL